MLLFVRVTTLFLTLSIFGYRPLCAAEEKKEAGIPVLLLYSSGVPFAKTKEISGPEQLEGITRPTPIGMNTRVAAVRIRKNLEQSGILVHLSRIEDMTDWQEVDKYKIIVIGSATRFWNMTWETKRFFDEVFYSIYLKKGKAKDKTFAIFTTAEITPCGEKALAAMESAIRDSQGKIALRMIIHWKMPLEEAGKEIDKFSESLATLAR